MTSPYHKNGTERIAEAFIKEKDNFDLVVDIQGDEPLISPYHIDEVIKFHKKNFDADIILPTLKINFPDNPNLIKVVTNKKMKQYIYLEVKYHLRQKAKLFF